MTNITPGERRFWEAAAALKPTINPHLHHGRQAPDSPSGLGGNRTHLYAVDTSTGVVVSGSMETERFKAAAADMSERHGFASSAVALRSAAIAIIEGQPGDEARKELLTIVSAATTCSMLFQQVRRSADMDGHWIFYAYKLANGDALSRVVFANVNPTAHMAQADVLAEVRRLVGADLANTAHPLFQHIKSGGGAMVAPEISSVQPPQDGRTNVSLKSLEAITPAGAKRKPF